MPWNPFDQVWKKGSRGARRASALGLVVAGGSDRPNAPGAFFDVLLKIVPRRYHSMGNYSLKNDIKLNELYYIKLNEISRHLTVRALCENAVDGQGPSNS